MSARAAVYSFCAADEGGGRAAWSVVAVVVVAAVAGAGVVVAALAAVVAGAAKTLAQVRLASSKANCECFMHPSSVSRSEARAGRRLGCSRSRPGHYRAPSSSAGAVAGVI